MSEITPELVRHLAGLARIEVSEAEVAQFASQLALIKPSLTQAQALSGAADSESGRFKVSAILDED